MQDRCTPRPKTHCLVLTSFYHFLLPTAISMTTTMTQKYFLIFFLGILFYTNTHAQQELGTHFLTETWQSTVTNPAFVPEKKWTVALPSVHYNFQHQAGGFGDILRTSNGQSVIDFGNFITQLESENSLHTQVDIPSLELAYKMGNLRLSIGHQTRLNAQFDYPKTFAELIWNGNAPFIGETVEFGPQLNLFSYSEIGLGAAYQLSKLTIGAKVKYLSGIGAIATNAHQASLYTSDDIYQLTFATDYEIQTSSFLEINDLQDFNFNVNQDLGQLFSSNTGFALDLGIRYQVNDKLQLNASIIDLGSINWQDGISYHSQGTETYEGIDLTDFILNDSIEFDIKLDTLQDAFQFAETSRSFSTNLNNKIYLGGNYQLNERFELGLVYLIQQQTGDTQHAFALSARAQLLKILTLGATYSTRYEQFDNLGVNLVARLGPVQVFGLTDNVFGLLDGTDINGRVGLNLVF